MLSRSKLWRADRRGAAAVEFAFILPILLIFYLGTYEGSQAISANRKVEAVANTVGDLVSRSSTMDATRLANITDIAGAILSPFSADGLTMVVTTVRVDATGKATVDWSKASRGSALAAGSAYALPADLKAFTDTYLVFSTVRYDYKTLFSFRNMIPDMTMGKTSSFRPRKSSEIPWS
jgi:Flp pilus assembly protein TadG